MTKKITKKELIVCAKQWCQLLQKLSKTYTSFHMKTSKIISVIIKCYNQYCYWYFIIHFLGKMVNLKLSIDRLNIYHYHIIKINEQVTNAKTIKKQLRNYISQNYFEKHLLYTIHTLLYCIRISLNWRAQLTWNSYK